MEHVDAILRICASSHGHDRVMAPGIDALRSFGSLLLTRPGELQSLPRDYDLPLNYDEACELPFRAGWIYINRIAPGTRNCANFKKDWELRVEAADLDGAVLESRGVTSVPLLVRNWQPGDQMQRPGHGQPEKIKTLFQEGRVLLWERRHWPVVVAGDEIVWARQFGPGAKFAASAETNEQVRITYREAGG
jgi:tRNA(Ile)-lysidine synthetase-like protein